MKRTVTSDQPNATAAPRGNQLLHEFSDCFAACIRRLEDEPGLWLVRCVRTGTLWRNRATRRSLNAPEPFTAWSDALLRVHTDDRVAVEDAYSRCLKFQKTQHVFVRMVDTGPNCIIVTSFRCRCSKGCGLVFTLVCPDEPETPA